MIKIIFGGIQYMSTDAFQKKGDAKKTIENAIWGLVLILSAWLILYTINPNLVNFDFSIEGQAVGQDFENVIGKADSEDIDFSNSDERPGTKGIIGSSAGEKWGDDFTERADVKNIGVTVNRENCKTIGQGLKGQPQPPCTSLHGVNNSTIDTLAGLMKGCNLYLHANNCEIRINGGTEYWLHGNRSTEIDKNPTFHKPMGELGNGMVLDIDDTPTFNGYLRAEGVKKTGRGCSELSSEKWLLEGALFVNEGNHWHVCF